MRAAAPFSAVERDLLEHLAAQAAVTLENLRLEELMRRKEAELRAILEGVADAIAAEDPDGRLVFVNARRGAPAQRRATASAPRSASPPRCSPAATCSRASSPSRSWSSTRTAGRA